MGWVEQADHALSRMDADATMTLCASALNRFRARRRGSGVEVEQRFFHALRMRDGQAVWWSFFDSKAEALEAVGLRE